MQLTVSYGWRSHDQQVMSLKFCTRDLVRFKKMDIGNHSRYLTSYPVCRPLRSRTSRVDNCCFHFTSPGYILIMSFIFITSNDKNL